MRLEALDKVIDQIQAPTALSPRLARRLGGPQKRSVACGEVKNLLFLSEIDGRLSYTVFRGTEKTKDSRCPDWNSNWLFPEYKSENFGSPNLLAWPGSRECRGSSNYFSKMAFQKIAPGSFQNASDNCKNDGCCVFAGGLQLKQVTCSVS
jgi:hypothetical protein